MEWHPWVTVPERVAEVPMSREILEDAVCLPRKHCTWKNCSWTGETNSERYAHVRAKHWSSLLAEATSYYHADTSENFRLETVLG